MKTVIRTSCEETELEWPDRRLFCLLLWDRRLQHCRLFKSRSRSAVAAESDPFPPPRSRGVQRDPLGSLSQNRRRISGWELESQIWGPRPCAHPALNLD